MKHCLSYSKIHFGGRCRNSLKTERRAMNIKSVQPHELHMHLPATNAQEEQLMITTQTTQHVGSDAPHVEK